MNDPKAFRDQFQRLMTLTKLSKIGLVAMVTIQVAFLCFELYPQFAMLHAWDGIIRALMMLVVLIPATMSSRIRRELRHDPRFEAWRTGPQETSRNLLVVGISAVLGAILAAGIFTATKLLTVPIPVYQLAAGGFVLVLWVALAADLFAPRQLSF